MCDKLSVVADDNVYHFHFSCLQPALFCEKLFLLGSKESLPVYEIYHCGVTVSIKNLAEGDQLTVYLQ